MCRIAADINRQGQFLACLYHRQEDRCSGSHQSQFTRKADPFEKTHGDTGFCRLTRDGNGCRRCVLTLRFPERGPSDPLRTFQPVCVPLAQSLQYGLLLTFSVMSKRLTGHRIGPKNDRSALLTPRELPTPMPSPVEGADKLSLPVDGEIAPIGVMRLFGPHHKQPTRVGKVGSVYGHGENV